MTTGRVSVAGLPVDFTGIESAGFSVAALTVSACTLRLGEDQAISPLTDVTVAGGGTLDLAGHTTVAGLVTLDDGTITGGSLVAAAYTLNNGTISASLGGSGGLVKNTTGKVVISSANTYTGTTTVNDGILNVRHGQALGSAASAVTVRTTLQLEGADFTINRDFKTVNLHNLSGNHTLAGTIALIGSGSGSTFRTDAGMLTIIGDITANTPHRNLTIQGIGNGAILGAIQDGATAGLPITKMGPGTWTFGGSTSNTYSGTTDVQRGLLILDKTGAVAVPATLNVGDGSGNDSFVRLAGSGANQIADTATVYVFKGETLDLNGRDEAINLLARGTTGSSTASPLVTNNAAGTTATLTVGAAGGSGGFLGTIRDGAGQVALVKAGTGTYTALNDYAYTGLTRVDGGAFVLDFHLAGAVEVGPAALLSGAGGTMASLAVAPDGVLELEIGPGGADRLTATATATLAGRLAIPLADGFAPPVGSRFDLLEAAAIQLDPTFVLDTRLAPLEQGYWDYEVVAGGLGQLFQAVVRPWNLDVDGNGLADPMSDGILVLRYLFDPAGPWNVSDALGSAATRVSRPDIRRYLDAGMAAYLDADGNGLADPLSDGILILRYLFEPTGAWPVEDAVDAGATRTSCQAVKTYLEQFRPESPPPDTDHLRFLLAAHLARRLADDGTSAADYSVLSTQYDRPAASVRRAWPAGAR